MATTDSTLNIADPGSRTGPRSRPKSTMDIQSSMKGIMSKVRETYSEESPFKKQQRILADWSANWDSAISESFGDESPELRSKKEEIIDLSPSAEASEYEEVTGKAPKGADALLRDKAFMNQLTLMQDKYPKLTSQEIFSVIEGESSFRTSVINPDTGAKGLFQITPKAAKEAGINFSKLEKMSPAEQLKEYDKYLQRWGYDGSYSLGILQAAPSYREASEDTVVYTKKSKGGKVFELNPSWFNQDGVATVGSINKYYGYES